MNLYDKFLHSSVTFGIIVSITSIFYFLSLPLFISLIIGIVLAIVFSVGKEHFDKNRTGFSISDLIADFVGIGLGIVVVVVMLA